MCVSDQVCRSQKSQLGPTLREIWTRERDRGGCRSVARPHRCRPAALRQVHPQRTLRPLDSRPVQAADCKNGQRRDGAQPSAPARPHLRRAPAPQRPAARRRPRAAASGTSKKERRASEETHGEQRVAGLRPDGLRGAPGRGHRGREARGSGEKEIFGPLRRRRRAARARAAAGLFSDDARDAVLSLVDTAVLTVAAAVGKSIDAPSGLLLLAAAPFGRYAAARREADAALTTDAVSLILRPANLRTGDQSSTTTRGGGRFQRRFVVPTAD